MRPAAARRRHEDNELFTSSISCVAPLSVNQPEPRISLTEQPRLVGAHPMSTMSIHFVQ